VPSPARNKEKQAEVGKRYVTIWFRYLRTDYYKRLHPHLQATPFVLASPDHGRMVITAASIAAERQGIHPGMVVADARALFPTLEVLDDKPDLSEKLLTNLAAWLIRYTPITAIDLPDGIVLDASGCTHLWSGEAGYMESICKRLTDLGYHVRAAMADTIGTAWAVSRYGVHAAIVPPGEQLSALLPLPPEALRVEPAIFERMHKLGLRTIGLLINIATNALRRRFGASFVQRLHQALGQEEEFIQPVEPVEPFQERLPCLEPIATAAGIEVALERLLELLCKRMQQEGKGLRTAVFLGYRVDGNIQRITINTGHASHNPTHLFKLFTLKIDTMEPALGFELFVLKAERVEDVMPAQEKLWNSSGGLLDTRLAELIDRIETKIGPGHIYRYLPREQHLPELAVQPTASLQEKPGTAWRTDKPRPLYLLSPPELIPVTAPIPDYPPMSFRYKGKLHKVVKADGPERIEMPWWIKRGEHRDYYCVENEAGLRFWLFRLGHYDTAQKVQWFMHGLFS
jgi:protein ImuB